MEFFKKGQIVPKRLGFVLTHRKSRVNVTFGCDVSVHGSVVTPIGSPAKSVIHCIVFKGRIRKNGTIQRVQYQFNKFSIDCSKTEVGAAIKVKL